MAAADQTPSLWWLFFGWSGRLGRAPYGLAWAFWLMLMSAFLTQIMVTDQETPAFLGWALAFFASGLVSTVSSVMLTIKRLHDMGAPAPLVICLFIPAISFFALIAFLLWPGTAGPNAHGALTNRPRD